MKIIRGINNIKRFKKPVVALGVFDGVHLGHVSILRAAVRRASSVGVKSVALTFDPHPQKEESLTSLEHRLRLIAEQGIDICIIINFNKKFKSILAADFIKDILVKKLEACYVYVGRNFRFGRNAEGSIRTLEQYSKAYHYNLKVFDVIKINHRVISSTFIRNLIKKGDFKTTEKLLLRPVTVLGSVIKGSHLGKKLGFPTANINPHHEVIPPEGVYAVKVIFGRNRFNGVCNIGTRPTFSKKGALRIEVHLFNFHKNIYGRYIEIEFIKKIREEKKFPSAAALAENIKKDITFARTLFARC